LTRSCCTVIGWLLAPCGRGVYPPPADSRTPGILPPTSLATTVLCCRRPVCSRPAGAAPHRHRRMAV